MRHTLLGSQANSYLEVHVRLPDVQSHIRGVRADGKAHPALPGGSGMQELGARGSKRHAHAYAQQLPASSQRPLTVHSEGKGGAQTARCTEERREGAHPARSGCNAREQTEKVTVHTSHRDMRAKHIARCTVIWMGGGGRHIHTTMIVTSQEGGSEAATKRSGASACVSLPDCASTTSSNIRGILVRVVDAAVVTCTVRSRRGSHAVMFCWMRERRICS